MNQLGVEAEEPLRVKVGILDVVKYRVFKGQIFMLAWFVVVVIPEIVPVQVSDPGLEVANVLQVSAEKLLILASFLFQLLEWEKVEGFLFLMVVEDSSEEIRLLLKQYQKAPERKKWFNIQFFFQPVCRKFWLLLYAYYDSQNPLHSHF